MPETVVVTQKGDRLVELTKRVYGIRDPDRALTIALAVATMTARNRGSLANRVGVPLEAGLSIDFPDFESVQGALKAQETRRKAVQNRVAAGAPFLHAAGAASAPRAVGIVRQVPLGERTMIKDMLRALGANATTLTADLRPLGTDDVDPNRTQSAVAARVIAFGRKVAMDAPRGTVVELFAQTERGFGQAFEMVLRAANSRAFLPNVDIKPTLIALYMGFFTGIVARLTEEAKAELERRKGMLERAISKLDPATLPAGVAASIIYGADPVAATAALKAALSDGVTIGVTPGVRAQLNAQYGLTDSASREKLVFAPLPSQIHPLLRFLDALYTGGSDGSLSERVLALATRVSDAHRQAVQEAVVLVADVELDESIAAPNLALAEALPTLLKTLRDKRTHASVEDQTRFLADERHLLSGRNFVSFRKDIAAHLDKRISMAVSLTQRQRVAVVLALFLQDGHRLPAMRKEDIETALDRLVAALA